jgi:hypothetical protein
MANLIVVVDPDYAVHLERAAQTAPLWIVSTQMNREACEQLWMNHPYSDHRENGAITCYKTLDPQDRLGSLLGVVPALETHHGEVQDNELVFPTGFVLEVIGLALADDVTDALREIGFTSFIQTTDGLQACK